MLRDTHLPSDMDHGPDQVAQSAYDAGQQPEDAQAPELDSWGGVLAEQVTIEPDLLNSSELDGLAEETSIRGGDDQADRAAPTSPGEELSVAERLDQPVDEARGSKSEDDMGASPADSDPENAARPPVLPNASAGSEPRVSDVSTDSGREIHPGSEGEELEAVEEERSRLFSSIRRRVDGAARATSQDTSDSELVDKGGFRDLLGGESLGEGPVFYNTFFSREQLASALALSERVAGDEDMVRMLGDRSVSHSQAMVALREARPLEGMRILDLGCGQVPSFALAAQALGADMHTADAHDIEDQTTKLQLSGDGAETRHTIVNFNDPHAAEILRQATRGGGVDLVSQSNLLPVQGDLQRGIGFIGDSAARQLAASLLRPGGHYWNGKLYRRPTVPDTNDA